MKACRDTWQNSIEASQALPLTICSMLGPAQLERVNAFNPKSDSSHRPDIDNVLSVYMQNSYAYDHCGMYRRHLQRVSRGVCDASKCC